MKILTKKKQDEILKRIVANEIIVHSFLDDLPLCEEHTQALSQYMENTADISFDIGGIDGLIKVVNTIDRILEQRYDK